MDTLPRPATANALVGPFPPPPTNPLPHGVKAVEFGKHCPGSRARTASFSFRDQTQGPRELASRYVNGATRQVYFGILPFIRPSMEHVRGSWKCSS